MCKRIRQTQLKEQFSLILHAFSTLPGVYKFDLNSKVKRDQEKQVTDGFNR